MSKPTQSSPSRRDLLGIALGAFAATAASTGPLWAQAPAAEKPPASAAPAAGAKQPAFEQSRAPGLGASGYDVVAYFTKNAAVKGEAAHTLVHEGVTWQFSSAENLAVFKADPAKYVPQYGGYCAWAVASNYTAPSDPEAFSIVDGKLYLNYSRSVRLLWARDAKGNITKGNTNWPLVLTK